MAGWDDVRRIALALPHAAEERRREQLRWTVDGKLFVWERPLRPSDLRALGDTAPQGPILGVRVEHLGAKEAWLVSAPHACFTTPHFDGYPAVLVRLETVAPSELEELVVDAWLARAPTRLARGYVEARR